MKIYRNLIYPLILLSSIFPLPGFSQDISPDSEFDFWDTPPRAAYFSYLLRESHNHEWYRNPDKTALRATIGSISTSRYLVDEEARIVAPITGSLLARFYYKRHEEFDTDIFKDRAELEWRTKPGIILGILGSAFYEKEDMDIGAITGYYHDPERYIQLYYIAHRWLFNEKEKDGASYKSFPNQYIVEGRYGWNNYRIILEAFFEQRWRLKDYIEKMFIVEVNKEGYQNEINLRVENINNNRLYGVTFSYFKNYLCDKYGGITPQEISTSSIVTKLFYFKRGDKYSYEADFPVEYFAEDYIKRASSPPTLNRDRRGIEIYPQVSVRRHFGKLPFAELVTMAVYRNLDQTGNFEEPRTLDEINPRIGISAGIEFPGGNVNLGGENRSVPRGELRLRVMQNLDRNWVGSFGGGNLLLVFAW